MNNFNLVLRTYTAMRQMSPDDLALLNTLRALNDVDRQRLIETMSDKPQKKAGKKSVTTTREYDHCLRCGTTKRDSSHKDQSSPDYHEFQSSKDSDAAPAKSARASGMAKTISDNLSQRRQETIDDVVERDTGEPARCQFTRADGNPCKLLPDHNIHHMTTANEYHEFVAPPASSAAGAGD